MTSKTKPDDPKSVQNSSVDRKILAIAGPAILANSSAPLVGLVDAWALGHLSSSVHLAAIGVGATIFTYVFWAFGFLRMGTTGFVAQAFGRDDHQALVRLMLRVIITALVIAFFILVLQDLLFRIAAGLLAPPGDVTLPLARYYDIRVWSAPATLVFYGINGFLIGTARTTVALWLHLLLNLTNGALNLILVIGLGMGVSGVAWGTLVAEWLTVIVGGMLLVRYLGVGEIHKGMMQTATWRWHRFVDLFHVNSLLLLRTLLLMTVLAMVVREAGKLGTTAVAASHIASTFLLLVSLGLDSFAYAGEALAGAAWGRGNQREFRSLVIRTSLWAGGASLAYALFFAFAGHLVTALITDLADVRAAVADIMPVLVVLPLIAVACYQFDGIYIGATAAGMMLLSMALASAGFFLVAPLMGSTWGLAGVWGAVLVFMGARGLAQLALYPLLERKLQVS